jgi:hypothetical protein
VAAALSVVADVERQLAALRARDERDGEPLVRTSVMTHIAWLPRGWVEAGRRTLAGMGERHPSRTILLLPEPEAAEDGVEARVSVERFALESQRIATEVIELRLRGTRAAAPRSIVEPLLIFDLPVFLRWRGQPPFGAPELAELVELTDRLIVDSTEWPDVPAAYAELARLFDRAAVSDIAWARTSRWRRQLASLWPGIAGVERIRVRATAAQAHLLRGWLASRLRHPVALEHEPAEKLVGVDVDGERVPLPPGEAPDPSDLLSDELDKFDRDPVYEAAVTAAASGTV